MNSVVYIETAKRTGSGVILKCEYDNDNLCLKDEESYIILTNYHVLQDLNQNEDNQRKYVDLEIWDVNGDLVDPKYITQVYYASGKNYDNTSDVAALLIFVKKMCKVQYSNVVSFEYGEQIEVETVGYPYVFQEDLVNRELRIEGKVEKYSKEDMGIYKIMDDYHWYADMPDKKLFEGLSGAPVYTNINGSRCLLGINQSFCNIGEGKNPFKFVYFLKIKSVLEWLREQGIILFKYYKNEVHIVWLSEKKEENRKSLVLVGSSGAGKSAFLNTLCLNGKSIDSSGDGQTTRNIVKYILQKYCADPHVVIKYWNEKEFVEVMIDNVKYRMVEYICCNKYGMNKKDIMNDNMVYLREILVPLEYLAKNNYGKGFEKVSRRIKHTMLICEDNSDVEDYDDRIIKTYSAVFATIEKYLKSKSQRNSERQVEIKKLRCLFNKQKTDEYIRKNQKDIDIYYRDILNGKYELETTENKHEIEEFRQVVEQVEGFFDVSEFNYLNNEIEGYFKALFEKKFVRENKLVKYNFSLEKFEIDEEDEEKQPDFMLLTIVKQYYSEIYQYVKKQLMDIGENIGLERKIELSGITMEEKNFLSKCMRKVNEDSLTSLVKEIVIYDSFANEYALDLKRKAIEQISFYDTCGIDHINRGNYRIVFQEIFNEVAKDGIVDGIIYVKKLDSGKPVELNNILPILNSLQSACPIFCIFTGMDQFIVGKREYIGQMLWKQCNYEKDKDFREIIYPKAVVNIYEDKTFVDKLKASEKIKERMYTLICNNLVPYASKYSVQDDDIIELNRKSLGVIVKALLIDEWNLGFVGNGKNISNNKERLKEVIKSDLAKMFDIASVRNWETKHHMTIMANFRRIFRYNTEYDKKNPTLGFNRSQINRWDNLLQNGYTEVFLNRGKTYTLLVHNGLSEEKAYSILSRMKDKLLLNGMQMWDAQNELNGKKTDFRIIFEKMYERCKTYQEDVFKRHEKGKEQYVTIGQKKMFLNNVCDFSIGFETISDELVNYVEDEVCKMIEQENERCLRLILKHDKEFFDSVKFVDNVIKKYSFDKSDTNLNLWDTLQVLLHDDRNAGEQV